MSFDVNTCRRVIARPRANDACDPTRVWTNPGVQSGSAPCRFISRGIVRQGRPTARSSAETLMRVAARDVSSRPRYHPSRLVSPSGTENADQKGSGYPVRAPRVVIRRAGPGDLAAIQALNRQFALAEGTVDALDASEADLRRDLFGPAPKFTIFLAEHTGKTIGMIVLSELFSLGQSRSVLHINNVFVAPECRSRGIGRALLGRAAQEAIGRQARFIELGALKRSRARPLYAKAGFAQVDNYVTYVLAGSAISRLAAATHGVADFIG